MVSEKFDNVLSMDVKPVLILVVLEDGLGAMLRAHGL